jgi:uncharacterized protein (TIGR02246 family)
MLLVTREIPQQVVRRQIIRKHREERMRTGVLLTVAGLAIGSVLTFAQQKDTVDPQTANQLQALTMQFDEAFNKNDSVALAALFTENAVVVTPHGVYSGRQAIEKMYADAFKKRHFINFIHKADQANAVGNEAWSVGEWSCAIQGQNGPVELKGYYSRIDLREGDVWRIRMSTYNVATEPQPPAEK